MRVLAVINEAAGGPTEEYVGLLKDTGVELELMRTEAPGDGARCTADAVAAAGPDIPDIVVSVGGDGTAGEVARGLALVGPGAPPLLIAPAGTGNSNYLGLWDDLPWAQVVGAVFGERRYSVRPMDLLHLAELDTATLLGVSAGMIPECLELVATMPGTGREKLFNAAVQVLADYTPYPSRVSVDGRVLCECAAVMAVVGGVRYRGGMLKLLPDSVLDDGLLDVCVVDAAIPLEVFGPAALAGTLAGLDGVHYGRGREISLERLDGAPMKLEHDGELATGPHTGYHLSAVPGPFTVVVPDPVPACFSDSPN